MGVRLLEKGGVEWLERNVIYGVTVARGQTHPGHPTRYGVLARAWALSPHANVCVVCSFVDCRIWVSCIVYTQFLLHIGKIFNTHNKSRTRVTAVLSDSCRVTASVRISVSLAHDTLTATFCLQSHTVSFSYLLPVLPPETRGQAHGRLLPQNQRPGGQPQPSTRELPQSIPR